MTQQGWVDGVISSPSYKTVYIHNKCDANDEWYLFLGPISSIIVHYDQFTVGRTRPCKSPNCRHCEKGSNPRPNCYVPALIRTKEMSASKAYVDFIPGVLSIPKLPGEEHYKKYDQDLRGRLFRTWKAPRRLESGKSGKTLYWESEELTRLQELDVPLPAFDVRTIMTAVFDPRPSTKRAAGEIANNLPPAVSIPRSVLGLLRCEAEPTQEEIMTPVERLKKLQAHNKLRADIKKPPIAVDTPEGERIIGCTVAEILARAGDQADEVERLLRELGKRELERSAEVVSHNFRVDNGHVPNSKSKPEGGAA